MSLDGAVQSATARVDAEFAERYEAERAKWLRRRFLWYCGAALVILLFSITLSVIDLAWGDVFGIDAANAEPEEGVYPQFAPSREVDRSTTVLDLAGDSVLFACFLCAAVFVARRTPTRRLLVNSMTWLIMVTAPIVTVVFAVQTYVNSNVGQLYGWDHDQLWVTMGLMALIGLFLIHFLGSLFMALTLGESLRALLPVLAMYAALVLLFSDASLPSNVALLVLSPLFGLPGLLYSWWRARRHAERFRSRAMHGRLGEITLELAYARRIHEALFPPAIMRGPVRVEYLYEPMREIGGDFLFVHPLSFPPSALNGPLSIALLDVSGHGVAAALAVNRLHGELARYFAHSPRGAPGELLASLNFYAAAALAPQGVFATALCLSIDAARSELEWASAGHPPALLRSAEGVVHDLGATSVMLGVVDAEFFHPAPRRCAFRPGDVLVAYTDGASEARGARGELFTIERLRALLAAPLPQPRQPGTLARRLSDSIRLHRRGAPTDDTLLVEVTLAI